MSEVPNTPSRAPHGPRCIYLAVTDRCFLPCVHCHMWKHRGQDIPQEAWLQILDRVAAWCPGASVMFVGGEPLLRRDLSALIAHAVARGLRTALCTNGWLVTERRAHQLAEAGLAYAYVSLDGMRAETVDATRGKAGSFARALQALDLFSRHPQPRPIVSYLLHAHNATQLPKLLAYARKRGYLVMLQALGETLATDPQPRWWERSALWPNAPAEQQQVQKAIARVAEEQARGGVVLNTPEQLEATGQYYRDPGRSLSLPCPAGSMDAAIDAHGQLYLCFYRERLGTVLHHDQLAELWQSQAAEGQREQVRTCSLACRLNTSNLGRIP